MSLNLVISANIVVSLLEIRIRIWNAGLRIFARSLELYPFYPHNRTINIGILKLKPYGKPLRMSLKSLLLYFPFTILFVSLGIKATPLKESPALIVKTAAMDISTWNEVYSSI
jgi:hypothetical protein